RTASFEYRTERPIFTKGGPSPRLRDFANHDALILKKAATSSVVSRLLRSSDPVSSADDISFSTVLLPRLKITASSVKIHQNDEAESKGLEKLEWSRNRRVSGWVVASAPITSATCVQGNPVYRPDLASRRRNCHHIQVCRNSPERLRIRASIVPTAN